MTEMELCKAVAAFVAGQLEQISWVDGSSTRQFKPKTIIGFYPPKRSAQDDDNPYVFVVPQDGSTTTTNEQTATVVIYIGARCESLNGYEYMFDALERVRHAFLSQEGNIIEHDGFTFQMQFPFDWEYDNEQPYPFWVIKLTTHWAMPVTQQADPESYL